MNNMKLFFIPYAGASSMAFYKFQTLLYFDVVLMELAGRGQRIDEPFYNSIDDAAVDLSNTIAYEICENDDYYIFGHSMGALLAFEVYYKLRERRIKPPKHIFFSGRIPPQILFRERNIYLSSDDDDDDAFINRVSQFGGISDDFKNDEVKAIFLPILRADFKILDAYVYREKKEKIECDLSVLYADDDFSTPYTDLEKWVVHAGGKMKFCKFHGGHFFVNTSQTRISEYILNVVKADRKQKSQENILI